ncbi:MAG: DUF4381 family protein [Rhodobacteraceae bacterium]|nr:DUF4381 family protein [Paracoccaceae bacterium]
MSDVTDNTRSLVSLIGELQEVPDPQAVSMWPQTQGWIFVGLAGMALVLWGVRKLVLHRRANAYRHAALRSLAQVGDDPAAVSQILKQTALVAFPRHKVASLTGMQWLAFLDASSTVRGFVDGPGQGMATAAYAARPVTNTKGLNDLACNWVRSHKSERVQ